MFRFLLLFSFVSCSFQSRRNSSGCTAPFLQANKPFVVVWNEPSASCHGLNLTDWGIVENKDGRFAGMKLTIFYETNFGDWPHLIKRETHYVPHNGGIPQAGDLKEHLRKVQEDVTRHIPEKDFDGLGVVDFESWRPYFDFNFASLAIYQRKSVDLVKAEHPDWTNKTRIWNRAKKDFQRAARQFMGGTLKEVKSLRPQGRWGYYGFPRCFGVSKSRLTCAYPATSIANDKIQWMFRQSTALYPRIYTDPSQPLKSRWEYVREQIKETLRVQAIFGELCRPIMPYSMCQNGKTFFKEEDLSISIKEAADMGASGVILWGSSSWFHYPNECRNLRKYIPDVLGPFVKNVSDFMTSCCKFHCSRHGRCVRRDYEAVTQKHLFENNKSTCRKPRAEYAEDTRSSLTETLEFPRRKERDNADIVRMESTKYISRFNQNENAFGNERKDIKADRFNNYVCRCLPGWKGASCSRPA